MKTCPVGEKCDCGVNDDGPEYFKKHGRYSWDTEEIVGYSPVTIQLSNGRQINTRVFSSVTPQKIERLRKIYEIEHLLKRYSAKLMKRSDSELQQLITAYFQKFKGRFGETQVGMTPTFVRNGFELFVNTQHTFQELDPDSDKFEAVNKPKNVEYYTEVPRHGSDQKLRSYRRHIVIKLRGSQDYVTCLLVHELAHTPPNHICFRHNDHNDDFRIFQSIFLSILKHHKLVGRCHFV